MWYNSSVNGIFALKRLRVTELKMKKKRILPILSLALGTSFALVGCGSESSTNFSSGWYKNTTIDRAIVGTSETLVYFVALEEDSNTNDTYAVDYSNGVYRTTLTAENYNGEHVYRLESKLTINVQYSFKNVPDDTVYQDEVTSTVLFRDTGSALKPIRSEKTVKSVSPFTLTPTSLSQCMVEFHYSVRTEYNGKKGVCYYNDLVPNKDGSMPKEVKKNFTAGGDYSYVDNEQLLFAIRCMGLGSSDKLRVFNSATQTVQTINVSPSKAKSNQFTFKMNGEAEATPRAIEYYPTDISISSSTPGATQTAWYSKPNDLNNNLYRNVMLKLKTPLSFGLGTLVYTLTEANFDTTN